MALFFCLLGATAVHVHENSARRELCAWWKVVVGHYAVPVPGKQNKC